jgi:hypothetical protein
MIDNLKEINDHKLLRARVWADVLLWALRSESEYCKTCQLTATAVQTADAAIEHFDERFPAPALYYTPATIASLSCFPNTTPCPDQLPGSVCSQS